MTSKTTPEPSTAAGRALLERHKAKLRDLFPKGEVPDYVHEKVTEYLDAHDAEEAAAILAIEAEALANLSTPAPDERVTRFEVIDHRPDAPETGRVFVAKPCAIDLSYQDDGSTLKVFVTATHQAALNTAANTERNDGRTE